MTTLRVIALSAIITGISATDTPRAEVPVALTERLAGKSGEGLAAVLRRECRPTTLSAAGNITYRFYDHFTGNDVAVTDGNYPRDYAPATLVPVDWWMETELYGDTLANDLNNFIPLTVDVIHARRSVIPVSALADVTSQYDSWAVGHIVRYDTPVDAYAPPVDMRGRLARAFFYMAVMYPHTLFTPTAYMMMSVRYPYMTASASSMMIDWAEQYPPDDAEKEWTRYASGLQGGCNPFVEIPDLHEYIWGGKAGETFGMPGERVPLHSTYSIADGDRIELYSPHIPEDAVWSIDGMPAADSTYEARELGTGEHELTYTSASTGENGCVMIKIVNTKTIVR